MNNNKYNNLETIKQFCFIIIEKWLSNFAKEGNAIQIDSIDNTIIQFPKNNPSNNWIVGKIEIEGFTNENTNNIIQIFVLLINISLNSHFIKIGEIRVNNSDNNNNNNNNNNNINITFDLFGNHKLN
ncbi:MAG: hypothetical protein P1P85_03655 [Patescibacteria group bacterium]|nr:hypothetical protein [Patescibacteria group bacterium]